MEGNLKENGWFLSSEGIAECKKACTKENPTASEYLKAATNLDLKQYGTRFLPEDIAKGKIESIEGPGVLQIQKLRNIAAPRSNEESNHAPRLLKFQLTDGPVSCQGLEYAAISDISLSTPPGTKICLIGSVPVKNGALLLDGDNTKVLGGEVESLVCKWKLNKSLAKHSRATPSGEGGPPPFVPFSQAKTQENRGKSNSDQNRGSPTVANGHGLEKHSNHDHSDSKKQPDNTRYKQQDNLTRRGKDHDKDGERERNFETSHKRDERGDQRGDQRGRPRGDFRGDFRGDSRGEPRRYNQDRSYGKFPHDGRPNQRDNRGNRDYRGGNRNYDSSMGTSQSGDARIVNNGGERNNPRRTDHNRSEKSERPSQVSQANDSTGSQKSDSSSSRSRSSSGIRENGASDTQTRDSSEVQATDESTSRPHDVQVSKLHDGPGRGAPSGRGSARGGRGGRKDGLGRGRSNSSEQDESEDYRARQPSDKGTLWDFVETKLPVKSPPRTSTPPLTSKEPKENEPKTQQEPVINHAIEQTQEMVEESKSENEPQESAKPRPQSVDRSGSTERAKPEATQPGKDPKPQRANNEKNKEAEKTGRNVEPSTAPYRDNKQRQYQQRQQQYGGQGRGRGPRGRHDDSRSYNQSLPPRLQKKQQQYHQQHFYDRDRRASIEKESQREKTSSPGSGSSGDGRSSHSPIVESGAQSTHDKTSEEAYHRQQHQRRQKNYPRQQQRQQSEEYKSNVEQTSGPKQPQYDSQPAQSTYIPNQQGIQHPHYHVEQQQQQHMYEQHEGAPIIQQDYNYQQTPPPPPPPQQQYPMYQMQTQMSHPQAVMVTQPMTSPSQQHAQTPIPTAQIRWKKGSQCLALRRDGQYYSAKIEHVTPDGQQCMVSFQDFHGGCEMTSVTLLRPFPLMTWTEPNAQSMPVTTMTAVPVYAQPAQVAMVPRPQVMVPMQAQPPFSMGPKGPVPTQAPVPPQGLPPPPPGMQWQPAQMNYQDMRQQAYQPLLHYDPMAQANNPANRPTYYQMPPAGTVQFVRGVKELHGQGIGLYRPPSL